MNLQKKNRLARLRHLRVRRKISGTASRPRMSVKFTGQHIYVQFIDDTAGATLAATSTRAKDLRSQGTFKANVEGATGGRVEVDIASGVLRARGALTDYDRTALLLAMPEAAAKAVEASRLDGRARRGRWRGISLARFSRLNAKTRRWGTLTPCRPAQPAWRPVIESWVASPPSRTGWSSRPTRQSGNVSRPN